MLVQKDALMVLTHLILNDMIKIKGQISEIALCLVSSDIHIQQSAELFFLELSKKSIIFPPFFIFIGNSPIYNIFPDCISLLINNEDLSYENYSYIIQYLAKFIDKVCESSISSLNRRNRPQHWWISSASASP